MVFGDEKEMDAVFHSDSLRNPRDWPGVIVEMPIPVPLGRFSLVGGFSGLLWAGGFGGPPPCHSCSPPRTGPTWPPLPSP